VSGKAGTLMSVDGKTGETLWVYKVALNSPSWKLDVLRPIFLPDLNTDGVADILVSQGQESFPAFDEAAADTSGDSGPG
jgi:outer membrane protein assembly factor BamB